MKLLFLLSIVLISQSSVAELKDKAGPNPKPGPAGAYDFDYEFGRPIKENEKTYNDYRAEHAELASKTMGLSSEAVGDGMDTWHWWVGVDNPGFWQDLVSLTGSPHNPAHLRIDLFRLLLVTPRNERFKKLGLVNDPDAVAAEKPDQFGLMIDRMKDGTLQWDPEKFGFSSGVIGIQLFKNKDFKPEEWSVEKYLADGSKVQPPYRVGMACIFCHVGFNPLNPPANPEEPQWDNITSAIGNQYLREGLAFQYKLPENSLIYQYLSTQEAGTSETSRFPTDSINNPTVINSVYRLRDRLKEAHVEKISKPQAEMIKSMYKNAGITLDNIGGQLGGTEEEPTLRAPHILTDGSDSMGILMASVRVYVNEGMMHKEWYHSFPVNPFAFVKSLVRGFTPREFDILHQWRKDTESPWMQTERRMPNMATFLMSYDSFPLAKAAGGKAYLTASQAVVNRGKTVFAENCASCHSSKAPDASITGIEERKNAWRKLVMQDDFLIHNYLSDDERHSVLEIGTNVQRAEGSNAMTGSTWGQMSSETYKEQRRQKITLRNLYNPLSGKYDLDWSGPAAFYRTPSLVSIWATAPFFHNNSLGLYNADPSVKGRMLAFEDAMAKLLSPEKRLGIKSMKVTSVETDLLGTLPGLADSFPSVKNWDLKPMQMPAGTPVNLFLNLNPRHGPGLFFAYLRGLIFDRSPLPTGGFWTRRRAAALQSLKQKLLSVNTVPDFIEDRGHEFGSQLSETEKHDLTEYMKQL